MANIEETIEVDVPVGTAYNQWTQFESFPHFMEGVENVQQISDTLTHWTVKVAGQKREFDAEITEQYPDDRLAWRSTEGPKQAGVVTFHHLAEGRCKVLLRLEHEPEGAVEKMGETLGVVSQRVKGDLKRFKEFIEARGVETGAWRGNV